MRDMFFGKNIFLLLQNKPSYLDIQEIYSATKASRKQRWKQKWRSWSFILLPFYLEAQFNSQSEVIR